MPSAHSLLDHNKCHLVSKSYLPLARHTIQRHGSSNIIFRKKCYLTLIHSTGHVASDAFVSMRSLPTRICTLPNLHVACYKAQQFTAFCKKVGSDVDFCWIRKFIEICEPVAVENFPPIPLCHKRWFLHLALLQLLHIWSFIQNGISIDLLRATHSVSSNLLINMLSPWVHSQDSFKSHLLAHINSLKCDLRHDKKWHKWTWEIQRSA